MRHVLPRGIDYRLEAATQKALREYYKKIDDELANLHYVPTRKQCELAEKYENGQFPIDYFDF